MGKASRWFRNLLGLTKKPDNTSSHQQSPQPPPPATGKQKTRWSFVKSYSKKQHPTNQFTQLNPNLDQHETASFNNDPSKHAIAVAAATAAAAEAAVAAAHAAAEVVRLASGVGNSTAAYVTGRKDDEVWAAVKIQSAFRGYLARRALRALKGLVKIQALVRGHIERKRVAGWMHQIQVLMRAQARARAERSQISESPQSSSKSSHFQHIGPTTPEKVEHGIRAQNTKQDQSPVLRRNSSRSGGRISVNHERPQFGLNLSDRRLDERSWDHRGHSVRNETADDGKSDKILEVDMGKPVFTPTRRHHVQPHHYSFSDPISHSISNSKDSTAHQMVPSPSSGEVQSLSPLKFSQEQAEDGVFRTAENSPQFFSASSRGGSSRRSPFTPAKSDGSRSYLSGYADHPNYMAYTQSSRAKVRSLSAPKQRLQFEKSNSTKRYSIHGIGDSTSYSQKLTSLHANFTNKAYPGSGRLDRLGLPVLRGDSMGYRF